MSRGPAVVAFAVLLGLIAIGGIVGGLTGSDHALGLVVVAIGGTGLLAALGGKPSLHIGITERLLARLPDTAWRVVMALLGLAIIALGVVGLTQSD